MLGSREAQCDSPWYGEDRKPSAPNVGRIAYRIRTDLDSGLYHDLPYI